MAFKDLDEFLAVEPLELPIHGKLYAFPGEISARSWLVMQRLGAIAADARKAGADFDPEEEVLSDLDQTALWAELFGGTDAEMAADGLGSSVMNFVFRTLMIFHVQDRATAEAFWNSQGEVPGPNRAERRTRAKSTRSPASHAGSTAPKAKPTAPRGQESSDIGG